MQIGRGTVPSSSASGGTTGSLASTVGAANPLRYRGYYYDTETGLYYLQSRYYDPQVGRFISADAFASTGQGIVGFNMFAYCLNCPVMYVDTQGSTAEDIIDDEPDDVEPYRDPSGGAAGNPAYQAGGSSGTPQSGRASEPTVNNSDLHAETNPLYSVTYSPKVTGQLNAGDYHSFPLIVDNYGGTHGQIFTITGGDGRTYTRLIIHGGYCGHNGFFEYIWDEQGICNHRLFRPY